MGGGLVLFEDVLLGLELDQLGQTSNQCDVLLIEALEDRVLRQIHRQRAVRHGSLSSLLTRRLLDLCWAALGHLAECHTSASRNRYVRSLRRCRRATSSTCGVCGNVSKARNDTSW